MTAFFVIPLGTQTAKQHKTRWNKEVHKLYENKNINLNTLISPCII